MTFTLKNKVLFGLFLIVFLFILASYLVAKRIDSIKEHILVVNSLFTPISKTVIELKSTDENRGLGEIESFKVKDFEDFFKHFSRFLSLNDNLYLIEKMEKILKDYQSITHFDSSSSKEIELMLLKIKVILTQYNTISKNAYGLIRKNELTLDSAIEKFLNFRFKFNKNLNLFERYISRKMSVSLLTAERNGRDIVISLTVFMVIMTLIGLFIFYMTSATLKPLEDLYKGVQRLSAGDFSYKITLKKPLLSSFFKRLLPFFFNPSQAIDHNRNELELLAYQFNLMSRSILDRTKELRRSERLAAIGKISSEITHEIRNPLNSIGLNLSLLEEEIGNNKESKEILSSIKHEVDRLSKVTQSYLNYIKPVNVAFTKQSLNEIIWSVHDIFKNTFEQKKIECHINIPSEDIVIPVDKILLTQSLINLIKNAIEACDFLESSQQKKISITLRKGETAYVLSIVDNGPGIEKADMDKIFLPFFTRKKHGTGLGLGITYEIIKKHNGQLTCTSEKGKETIFAISLPRQERKNNV